MQNREVMEEESVGFLLVQYKYVPGYLQLLAEDNWGLKKVKDISSYSEGGYRVQHSYCLIPVDMLDREFELKAKQLDWRRIGARKHLLVSGNETLNAIPSIEERILNEYIRASRYKWGDFVRIVCYIIGSISCFLSSFWCMFHSTDFISLLFLSLLWCGVSVFQFWVLVRASRCIWRSDSETVKNIEKAKKMILGINENMIVSIIASIPISIIG